MLTTEYEEYGQFILPIVAGITAISGAVTSYFITHPKKPSDVIAEKLEKCAKDVQKKGYSPEEANKICLERFTLATQQLNKKPLSLTDIILIIGMGGLAIYGYKILRSKS